MEKLLTVKDVMSVCCVGYSTLYRWRKSGVFPESVGLGKLLWTEQQIFEWMNRQPAPVSNPVVTTPKERQQAEKSYQARLDAADAALERHRKAK